MPKDLRPSYTSSGTPLWLVVLAFGLFTGASVWALSASSPNQETLTQILQNEGYQKVQLTGYALFGCDNGDFWREGFTAEKQIRGADGQYRTRVIDGVLCSAPFKSVTIRINP